MKKKLFVSIVLLLAVAGMSVADIIYVDAVHGASGNTVGVVSGDHSDWQTTDNVTTDGLWAYRTGRVWANGGDVYEAKDYEPDVVAIKTTVTGLAPGDYDVYVYFASKETGGDWDIHAGLTATTLVNYDWTDGVRLTSFPTDTANLYRAYVGTSTVDSSGILSLFVDDNGGIQRSDYDGMGYAVYVPPTTPPYALSDDQVEDTADVDVTLSWMAAADPYGVLDVNPDLIAQYVYLSKDLTVSSDPNLYYLGEATVSLTDPNSSYAVGLPYNASYDWAVVDVITGPDYSPVVGESKLSDVVDPNHLVSDVASFDTIVNLPTIETQPVSVIVVDAVAAVFTVGATDPWSGTLSYEWRDPDDQVIGTDSATLTISSPTIGDEGDYYCIVSNTGGSVQSDSASLTIGRLIGNWFAAADPNDQSGNDNDITLVNGPTRIEGPLGAGSYGWQFDGVDQYATVTIDDVLNQYKAQMTMAFWLKKDGYTVDNARFINYGYYQGRVDIYQDSDVTDGMRLRYKTVQGPDVYESTTTTGGWDYFAAVLDGTTISLYKNGELADSGDCVYTSLMDVLDEPIMFGATLKDPPESPEDFSQISLADVQVYNYALDKWEIAQAYVNATGGSLCLEGEAPELDLNGDCVVDLYEFSVLASQWLLDYSVTPE